jgi:prevent-host-death family protein
MNALSASEAREHFSEIINLVAYGKTRQVLSRRGKELVAIIPIEELRLLERLENKIDLEDAKEELIKTKQQGTRSWKAIKKELGL